MSDISSRNFGLLIAYLIPGFIVIWGLGQWSPEVAAWLAGSDGSGPTIGGFLIISIASIAAGMTASALRWALVDTIHHATGVHRPDWSDVFLHERIKAYEWLVENHYRYYQFYANTLVALISAHVFWRIATPITGFTSLEIDASLVALDLVFFAGSRDALRRYYRRTQDLLGGNTEGENSI